MAKWYILHTISGSEKSVKKLIEKEIVKKNMSDYFEQIVIPTLEVPELNKRGQKILAEKKIMPGYMLIKMVMSDDSWHLVTSIPKTSGFLGAKNTPQSLNTEEVENIFKKFESETHAMSYSNLYNVGDKVQVIDGPFDSFTGLVEEVDLNDQKVKVSVSIFGKPTPIELRFNQIKKI
jgi:transcriptional antiterminator NusG